MSNINYAIDFFEGLKKDLSSNTLVINEFIKKHIEKSFSKLEDEKKKAIESLCIRLIAIELADVEETEDNDNIQDILIEMDKILNDS